ncbi:hypothetical protein DERP_010778 [Dermatophagoides pteronyssinus]|uniref:Uncharacterized protein n=2 Tax=Dermatophagoides pteronyssinus TaxID=6956 RepID=A0ABQ8J6Q5_DERPT|nr:uncharacterized protein LOC113792464 [Dermatophagoides pteronyssinus]KAH9418224.1 hypothetical protein DERP_010778 [Dermatophagoides pteronyssinus]
MDEVISFVGGTRRNRPNRGGSSGGVLTALGTSYGGRCVFVICTELGSIYVISERGTLIRKANVNGHSDIPIAQAESLRTLTGFVRTNPTLITIRLNGQTEIDLMYCHRSIQKVSGNLCRKILLLGNTSILFGGNIQSELLNTSIDTTMNEIDRCPPFFDSQCFDLNHQDEIELSNGGYCAIRVSSNRHYIYMEPKVFRNCVAYETKRLESYKKLGSILEEFC